MIYIVIPVHNRKATTLKCLHHLQLQSYRDYQIVVVDDGSTDGTAVAITTDYPAVTLLYGDGQLWWTGAIVKGIQHVLQTATQSDYVLSLNNDVIVEADYLQQLLNASTANGNAVVGSLCKDIKDHTKVLDAGIRISWRPYRYSQVPYRPTQPYTTAVDTISGRGVLIPIPVIKQIGNFARQQFPHYGADYEYGLRIKASGLPLVIANRAIVYLNDDLTGFRPQQTILSYRDAWKKMFSIKSPANVLVHLGLVWRHCPGTLLKIYNLAYLLAGNAFLFNKNVLLYSLVRLRIIKQSTNDL